MDRIIIKEGTEARLVDSLETAFSLVDDLVVVDIMGSERLTFSQNLLAQIAIYPWKN